MNRRKEEEEEENTSYNSEVEHLFKRENTNQNTFRIYNILQTILFSYSFLVSILLIIFIR
jgi:hypothetical protein